MSEELSDYYVINDKKKVVLESDDLFACLTHIKKITRPDYKVYRRVDKALLAFTSPPKFDITNDEY